MIITQNVLDDIAMERIDQDLQWGGPDHDDQHTPGEWTVLIKQELLRFNDWGAIPPDRRDALVKIAAIAVAAIESYDRTKS